MTRAVVTLVHWDDAAGTAGTEPAAPGEPERAGEAAPEGEEGRLWRDGQ